MKRSAKQRLLILSGVFCPILLAWPLPARGANVTAQIELEHPGKRAKTQNANPSNVVLWLTPESGGSLQPTGVQPSVHYRLLQHNKEFSPHLLVVPVGSEVEFPNRDPFYHNVFSQFNGKRFDLGLYESGTSRNVRFDHEGISYIFCNIHPEMGAVVIALRTPFFGVANPEGGVMIRDVPPGTYELAIWAEGGDPAELKQFSRRVQVAAGEDDLGLLRIHTNVQTMAHKNKFGEDYAPADASPY